MDAEILYEDGAVLVCRKPAGLAVQAAGPGRPDLVSRLKNYLAKEHRSKGGEPYLGVIHRLDQPVEGLLVFAKTKAAAASLSGQLASGLLKKQYLAVVWGRPAREKAGLEDWLIRDGASCRAEVVTGVSPLPGDARKAVLHYETAGTLRISGEELSLLRIRIETGRFHQIRAQLSHAGHPICGDRKYGGEELLRKVPAPGGGRMALCASALAFIHPVTGKEMAYGITPGEEPFSLFDGL